MSLFHLGSAKLSDIAVLSMSNLVSSQGTGACGFPCLGAEWDDVRIEFFKGGVK